MPAKPIQFVVAALLVFAASSAHADSPKTNYIVSGFVEETGSDLGYGNYQDSTASSGKQCRATFRVSEGKKFSITKTTARGPNEKPAAVKVKDPAGRGNTYTPSTQSDGKGWESSSNALNGSDDHDGTWTVILSYPAANKRGCSSYNNAVRIVLEASF